MTEPDDPLNPIDAVLDLAISSSWIRLAIEKYETSGGRLDYSQRSNLMKLTALELETLKRESTAIRGKRPGQDRQESGRIY